MAFNHRFSQNAQRALKRAIALSTYYAHAEVDTDHLFVGILFTEGSLGYQILMELEVSPQQALLELQAQHPSLETISKNNPPVQSGDLRMALQLTAVESRWLGHHYVGTEHMLLALIRQGSEQIDKLLPRLALSPEQIRGRTRRLLLSGVSEITIEAVRRMARLSELGRRVLNAATQVAQDYGQNGVTPEHLLLVLSRERRSIANRLLAHCGFHVESLERRIRLLGENLAYGEATLDRLIDRAVDRAEALGSHYTGTEHLLLAMTLSTEGQELLYSCGVDLACLQERLHGVLSGG